jgi:hypothetical protein
MLGVTTGGVGGATGALATAAGLVAGAGVVIAGGVMADDGSGAVTRAGNSVGCLEIMFQAT